VSAGQRVAVLGVGGLGHLAVQIAVAAVAEVIAIDVADDKLASARALGAAHAFDARSPDTPKAVRALGGAHIAVVTSAARAALDLGLKCLRPAGTLAIVGLPPEPLQFSALAIVSGEFRIVGSAVGTRDDLRATLELAAAGKLRCHCHCRPLAEANQALTSFAPVASGRGVVAMITRNVTLRRISRSARPNSPQPSENAGLVGPE
jgi:propanol-preferring alcohol dehydrogenase